MKITKLLGKDNKPLTKIANFLLILLGLDITIIFILGILGLFQDNSILVCFGIMGIVIYVVRYHMKIKHIENYRNIVTSPAGTEKKIILKIFSTGIPVLILFLLDWFVKPVWEPIIKSFYKLQFLLPLNPLFFLSLFSIVYILAIILVVLFTCSFFSDNKNKGLIKLDFSVIMVFYMASITMIAVQQSIANFLFFIFTETFKISIQPNVYDFLIFIIFFIISIPILCFTYKNIKKHIFSKVNKIEVIK